MNQYLNPGLTALFCSLLFLMAGCGDSASSSDSSDTGDADSDSDTDSDGDSNSDADGDSNMDTDSDTAFDTDTDTYSDTQSDAETDTKASTDTGADSTSDTGDGSCQFECLPHCLSWNGAPMDGACSGELKCCDGAEIPEVDTATDDGPPSSDDSDSGALSKDDSETAPDCSSIVIGFASEEGGTIGGCGGETISVSSYGELESAVSGSDSRVVQLSGTISGSGMMSVGSNKTIIGNGADATISGFGLNLSGQKNVIIQNLNFTNASDDAINVQTESTNIWIDHCSFSSGYDGLVDIKRGSSYITVSWNRFSNHHKTCLLGHSDDNASQDVGKLKVTYHHNYFDGSATRHPRARFGHVHVFNNYYRGCEYGVAATCEAMVLVEANYFENTGSPTLTQYGSSPSGNVTERDNEYVNSGTPQTRGDVPDVTYTYTPDAASDIPSIVPDGAGAGHL